MKQRTLAMTTGFERYSKKTRRALFLEEMEQVVPWAKLCALIEPVYPKEGNGRQPVGVERMLRRNGLGAGIFERVNEHLHQKGMRISTGTIVDATIVSAPSSTKNARGERDPEMHQTDRK